MAYGEGNPSDQTQNLPMTSEEVKEWLARIELDRQRRERESRTWQALYREFLPPSASGATRRINSNLHFRNVFLKIAEVWAQMPELILDPLEPLREVRDPMTGQLLRPEEITAVKGALLAKLLGRDHANVDNSIREALFDIFATSGIGATKICYQADVAYPPSDAPIEATPQPGAILNLGTPPTPQPQPVVVNERWRWYRFSTEKLIIPWNFHSTNYDESPYLGMEFAEPVTEQNLKAYNLPPDFEGSASTDDRIIGKDQEIVIPGQKKLIKGVEIWLYACHFDSTVANTQIMRRLVLIEGLKDRPAIYVNSPYQDVGPSAKFPENKEGQLTPDSMIGNPIHPITLRVAGDSAYPQSDSAYTDPLVRVENTMMDQDLKLRDANIPRFFHSDKITVAVDKLKNMDTGQGSAIADELMMRGAERLITPIPHLDRAISDTEMRASNQRALTETLGISPNQAGGYASTVRSATEVATVQANVSVRLKGEQNILLQKVLAGVRKFDALVQRYMTEPGYITIVGQNGARKLMAYVNAHLSGRYAYDAHPDSQLTIDQASQIKRYTEFVNFLAKSGFLNMPEVVRIGANIFGYDSSRVIQDPQPPQPPPPEQPKVSIALKAPDLIIPEVKALLQQLGINVPPEASPELMDAVVRDKLPQPMHGGAADKVDLVEKHSADQTGNQPGAQPINAPPVRALPPGQMVQ